MGKTSIQIKHKVAILTDGNLCEIKPDYLLVKAGDGIAFKNFTKDYVLVMVPHEHLLGQPRYRIEPGGQIVVEVQDIQEGDIYPYTVYYEQTRNFGAEPLKPRLIAYE